MAFKSSRSLPTYINTRPFLRTSTTGSNFLLSYRDSPSISWINYTTGSSSGIINVTGSFDSWIQKDYLKGSWPYAISLFKSSSLETPNLLFIYNMAKSEYKSIEVSNEAEVAMFLDPDHIILVLKKSFLIIETKYPKNITEIPAEVLSGVIPNLCISTQDSLFLIASKNTIQLWIISLPSCMN